MNKNTVVLIKIDAYTTNVNYIPYGLLYVANSLEKSGYEVKVLCNSHLHMLDKDLKRFEKIVKEINPIFVGFSVHTGRSTKISASFSKRLKEINKDVNIVWGGIHPTLLPEQCLSEKYIDYVVLGEGEETISELAKVITGKKDSKSVDGIGYKKNNEIHVNLQRPKIDDLDKYRPSWHLIDLNKYLKKIERIGKTNLNRVFTYLTSRGCPYSCAFCCNQALNNTKMRYHSIERVTSDINMLKNNYNIDGVCFNDDNFFVNRKRAFEIIEKVKLPYVAEARVNFLMEEEMVKKLKRTDCISIMSGGESGSNRILRYIKKGITTEQTLNATKMMAKYNVPLSYSFIIGFPNERPKEIMETSKFVRKLEKIYSKNPKNFSGRLGVFLPYPGTPLYDEAIEKFFIPPRKTEDWGVLERYGVNFDLPWLNKRKVDAIIKYNCFLNAVKMKSKIIYGIYDFFYGFRIRMNNFYFPFEISIVYATYNYIIKPLRKKGLKLF